VQQTSQRERDHKHHQRLGAGYQPSGNSQREQPSPTVVRGSIVGVMMMAMAVSVAVMVMMMRMA